jgi:hypothetical protein
MLLHYRGLAEALRSNATVDFAAAPPGAGAGNDNSRVARFFARLLHALQESRRMEAAREMARFRHLISPVTPVGQLDAQSQVVGTGAAEDVTTLRSEGRRERRSG